MRHEYYAKNFKVEFEIVFNMVLLQPRTTLRNRKLWKLDSDAALLIGVNGGLIIASLIVFQKGDIPV